VSCLDPGSGQPHLSFQQRRRIASSGRYDSPALGSFDALETREIPSDRISFSQLSFGVPSRALHLAGLLKAERWSEYLLV